MSVEISPLHANKTEIRHFSVEAVDYLAVGCQGWKWWRPEVGHRSTGCKHCWLSHCILFVYFSSFIAY